jgi:hypothetical protein
MLKIIFIKKIMMDRAGWKLDDKLNHGYRINDMSFRSFNEGYLNALKDFGIITEDKYFELGIKYGVFKKIDSKKENFKGCATCDVGTFNGFIDGLYEYTCRSAYLGVDDNFNYSSNYAHLKEGEKYPIWCPFYGKNKIKKVK